MVSGHHADVHSGLKAPAHRFPGPGAERVDHAGETQESEFRRFGRNVFRSQNRFAPSFRQGQDPVAMRSHLFRGGDESVPIRIAEAAHLEDAFRGALHRDQAAAAGVLVESGGKAAFGFEGDLVDLGPGFQEGGRSPAQFVAGAQEGDIDRISTPSPRAVAVMEFGLVAKNRGPDPGLEGVAGFGCDGLPVPPDFSLRNKSLTGDLEAGMIGETDLAHREFVGGKGACLVSGHQGATSQSFDRGEPPDDHPPPRHPGGRDGQSHRHRDGKAFGNGGHHQGDREEDRLGHFLAADQDSQQRDEDGGCHDGDSDRPGESFHPDDEGGLDRLGAHHIEGEFSHRGCGSGGDCQSAGPAPHHDGTRVGHVGAVRDRGGWVQYCSRVLGDGQRFAGKERLVDLEPVRIEKAKVGRHPVTGFQPEDIARNNLFGIDIHQVAVPLDRSPDPQQLLQGPGAALRLHLLDRSDESVEAQYPGDKEGVGQPAGDQ